MRFSKSLLIVAALICSVAIFAEEAAQAERKPARDPDIYFVPTPHEVVEIMLRLADVKKDDLVYDLGCGDGRIVVAAAKKVGCRAIGYDIDPVMVDRSLENVKKQGVEELVKILEADIFTLDLSEASVITLYLLPELNVRLIPQLEKLKPGSRIVSHDFDMAGVEPDVNATVRCADGSTSKVYLWTTPLKKNPDGAMLEVPREEQKYVDKRNKMVETQIAARGIKSEEVLNAMNSVPRQEFVPADMQDKAYEDMPLPIGEGQTISQPYIVALMTELLGPSRNMKILEIGTGSGYQAAVLAEICDNVFTVEINENLAHRAGEIMAKLGYDYVNIKIGDGYQGWQEHAPYDAVIVTCAPTEIPKSLAEQLKDGGKMVIPYGQAGQQSLALLTKVGGEMKKKDVIPVRFVPMVDKDGKTY